jgi:selenide,water dikinase
MCTLNSVGEGLAKFVSVHAMTDVTGFGLLGHLIEMCEGSKLSAEIDYKSVPLIQGIQKYMDQFIFPPLQQSDIAKANYLLGPREG